MRKVWAALAIPMFISGACWATPRMKTPDFTEAKVGDHTYRIPKEYGGASENEENGLNTIGVQFSRKGLGPLEVDVPGWEDNINVLILSGITSTDYIYDHFFNSSPRGKNDKNLSMYKIKKVEKINNELTYRTMGGDLDVVIVDSRDNHLSFMFMLCSKHTIQGSFNSCQMFFDHAGARWKITFGKEFMTDYKSIRMMIQQRIMTFTREGDEHESESTTN